jgi:NifU-like protein involved in Fe-S cluster formation/bacterioferritin-associated ferredoxin
MYDIESKQGGWFYSQTVKDHFFEPKNFVKTQEEAKEIAEASDGVGIEGSPACGDVMKMWIKVEDNKIADCKWQTFGCASAIAATSMFSVMVTESGGLPIDEALKIKPQNIVDRLDGLPARKFHCSVLADKAFREAVNDYYKKTNQFDKIDETKIKVVDKILNITDKDIEEAVLHGVKTLDELQKRTKIGVQDKNCLPEAEELLRYYNEKHFSGK